MPPPHGSGDVGFAWWPVAAAFGIMVWHCGSKMLEKAA